MKIIRSIEEMREYSQQMKRNGKTIANVSTTGYLHDGHMSLVKIAKENADLVVMTTNAMPALLFSREWPKDYKKYFIKAEDQYQQLSLENDLEVCKKYKIDVFFHPGLINYYPYPLKTITISHAINKHLLDSLDRTRSLTGSIISWVLDMDIKIWNSVLPDIIVEGQKDIHQTLFMKFFLNYFNFPIKMIVAPILRDSNGVALSSRNRFLTPSERQDATSIYKVLQEVASWKEIEPINYIKSYITYHVKSEVCSVDICCAKTLEDLIVLDRKALIVINAYFGKIILDDNIIIEP
jgi:pantoate--beta-alanine ligase